MSKCGNLLQKRYATSLLLCVISACLVLFFLNYANGLVFAFTPNMENLLVIQEHTIQSAAACLPSLKEKDRLIVEGYITRLEAEHRKALVNTTHYFENPINAYTLVRRLAADLNSIEIVLIKNCSKGYERKKELVYPTDLVLKGANTVFLKLVFTYNLNITEIANGTLKSNFSKSNEPFIEIVSPMTTSDCYELAQTAIGMKHHRMALAWAVEAFKKYPKDCPNVCSFTQWDIALTISLLYTDFGVFTRSLAWLRKINVEELLPFQEETYKSTMKILKHHVNIRKQQDVKNTVENSTLDGIHINHSTTRDFHQTGESDEWNVLCYGERARPNKLNCHYKVGPSPFLLLARLKAETLHLAPEITLFHDVISDEENLAMQRMAGEAIKTYPIQLTESDELSTSETFWNELRRFSCQGTYYVDQIMRHLACYTMSDEWPLGPIARRAKDMSGIDNDYSLIQSETERKNMIYVSEYGVGGYHNPHQDGDYNARNFFEDTVFYFLSESNQGGATIFTELNLTIFPKKNCALYWKNLLPNGAFDPRVRHAACPVVHGSKWGIYLHLFQRTLSANMPDEELPWFDA